MSDTGGRHNWVRALGWAAVGGAANLALPWLLARAARNAETRDFLDCHGSSEPAPHRT